MPVTINGQTYYRTLEVCRVAEISRSTLFRWLKEGVIDSAAGRDWRGWRLFNESQVARIKDRAQPKIYLRGNNSEG